MKYLKEGKWDDFQPKVKNIYDRIEKLKLEIVEMNKNLIADIAEIMIDLEDYQKSYQVYSDPSRSYLLCEYVFTIPSDKTQLASDLKDKLNDHIGEEGKESWEINWVNAPGANYTFRKGTLEEVWDYLNGLGAPEPKFYNVEFVFYKINSTHE